MSKRRWLWFVGALVVLHTVLLPILAHQHIVAALLGGGGEAWRLGVAVLFVVTRLAVLLVVPGVVVAQVGILVYDALQSRRKNRTPSA